MRAVRHQLAALAFALPLAGCDIDKPPIARPARTDRPVAQARIEKSIELPGGQGTVHVLAVPTGVMESSRCVVVTSAGGSPAVSCIAKDIDLAPETD